jgi:hypothetical protein
MGQEMIGWLTHLQHTRRKNVWFVGILERGPGRFQSACLLTADRRLQDRPGTAGHRGRGRHLAELKADDGASYRAFVCHTLNAWGYPAKDRSGRLDADRGAALRPPDGKDRRPRQARHRATRFRAPRALLPRLSANTESTSTQES